MTCPKNSFISRQTAVVTRDAPDAEALLLTGGLGTGKTSVAIQIGQALESQQAACSVVDLDWLCWAWSPSLQDDDLHTLLCDNLRAVLPNVLARAVRHVVLARAVLTAHGVDELRDALSPLPLRIVRLVAADAEVQSRLEARDTGSLLATHLRRRALFETMVSAATPDAWVVDTTGRAATDVATEVMKAVRWPLARQ
jgi:adenylylsulfate kinase